MTAMPTTADPDACPELGVEVPVGQIEKELRQLWEQDDARTNASLMNLVVYSEKRGALVENSAIVRDLTREHACRAILVEIDRYVTEPTLRAWITAHCHLAHGRKTVCCEQIAFRLTGKVTGRFRNTVFAHLNSDLPLVFWWQGELSDILTERLVSVMDRLIVDSSAWEDPAAGFRRIEMASALNSGLILQDHAWTRTWQFRLGVASVFDDPAAQKVLPQVDRVEIRHHRGHRNSALLLLAWLASQAGWRDRPSIQGFSFVNPAGGTITVALERCEDGPPLSEVVLRAGDRKARISQAAGADFVERHVEAPGYHVSSMAPADPVAPEALVALQLARGGKNSLFMKILPRFRKMLEA